MLGWSSLYEKPTALTPSWGHQRIYSPYAYASIRHGTVAPIILAEAMALAQYYPVCWRLEGDFPVLSVLRSLLPNGLGHYGPRIPLPLGAQVYPFVVPDAEAFVQQRLLVDDVIADQPTDIGAPLILDTGRMSPAALSRSRNALLLGRALPATVALSWDLMKAGMLESWPLRFDLGRNGKVDRQDLMVLSASKLSSPALFTLIQKHSASAGLFLGFHRLSLFRISALLQLAKAADPKTGEAGT